MADALKRHFAAPVVHELAEQIAAVWPEFSAKAFVTDALTGFESLELMPRGLHLARALQRHLPPHVPSAIDILCRASRLPRRPNDAGGMAAFFYLPHVNFIAEYGHDHFDAAMRAQHELTELFTAEFSIRAFLERHEAKTLGVLEEWTRDRSEHVRRLVSEGTRPRLPWARRLARFQADPAPVVALLERLKDDPSEYVRRSVANNLNDIGKDHPEMLIAIARRWMRGAGENRRALVRHALRSLVKAANKEALSILGFGHAAGVKLAGVSVEPKRVTIGGKVTVEVALRNPSASPARVLADLRVYFVKADGSRRPRVFKLGTLSVPSKTTTKLRKTVSLAELTTRRHYPGRHDVDFLLNGSVTPGTSFFVSARPLHSRRRV